MSINSRIEKLEAQQRPGDALATMKPSEILERAERFISLSELELENGETVGQRWKRHAEQFAGNQDAQRWARLGELAGLVKQALTNAQARRDAHEQP
jgi:hypothetical protein